MARTDVQPSGQLGRTDSAERRLRDINELLEVASEPAAEDLIVIKVRPIDKDGFASFMLERREYPGVRDELVPPDATEHPNRHREFFFVGRDRDVRLVYAEHETGWEFVFDVIQTTATVVALTPVVPTLKSWVGGFVRRIRHPLENRTGGPPVSSLAVEVHRSNRGLEIARVEVTGPFDEAAFAHVLDDAFVAGARALDRP
jgi:hypothetical protein